MKGHREPSLVCLRLLPVAGRGRARDEGVAPDEDFHPRGVEEGWGSD